MWTARLLVFASLFAPAALGELSSVSVCLCLGQCGRANLGTQTHSSHFVTEMVSRRIRLLSVCHPTATKTSDYTYFLIFDIYLAPLANEQFFTL